MPDLEDTAEVQNTGIFGNAFDDEDLDTYNSPFSDQFMGAEADFNNIEPLTIQEPTKIAQALNEEIWVEAMQEELLQFKIQKVSTLVDLPYGKKVIGTKWVYKNKKDERGLKQSANLQDPEFPEKVYKVEKALYGLHQAPRACYETLSTYLLDNGFYRGQIDKTLFIKRVKGDILLVQVYVDDIIFGSTKKSLCTNFEQIMHKRFQMSSMGELTFFFGLLVKPKEDRIFISQDKYVGEILKKFGFSSVKTSSTHMETNKALTKDEDGEDVDVHLYRSMIGSLMYLTSSRPDIMFFVCACLRFQVQPKVSHLNAVKRIFRYLKGRANLGIWYPKDSPFIFKAFSDSDCAGASLDRKSTIGGCQILGSRLISWQCKKQTVVANSTTEAEYSAASHCYGQVLWIQNQIVERAITTVASLDAAHDSDNIFKTQSTAMLNVDIPQGIDTGGSPRRQETMGCGKGRMEHQFELTANVPITPHDSPLPGGYTPESDEGRLKLQELMTMCTKLSKQVLDLEKAKDVQAVEILRLKKSKEIRKTKEVKHLTTKKEEIQIG
ncbi:putative ribonuclease H-like domain-containing protein [Tanacetum coccineum]